MIANTPGECVEGVAAMAGQQEASDGREEGSVSGQSDGIEASRKRVTIIGKWVS